MENILQIDNLDKSFGGVHAVDHCSFSVQPESITALVGPNGAGKTTVFNLISGIYEPDKGTITFDGEEISDLPSHLRARKGISRTFQLSRLFHNLSIEENLLLALRNDDDLFFKMFKRGPGATQDELSCIEDVLSFVGLKKSIDTKVTDLSYGQQKLFDIARALLNPHIFLMLDEPVAGVNPVLRERLVDLLKRMKRNKETVLLIEHDMEFVRNVADEVVVLDRGAVLAKGEPDKVLSDERVLKAYLGAE